MPNIASPLGTSQDYIPAINAGQLQKAAGLHIHFPTLAALNAAVTSEVANIAASSAIYADGQPFSVAGEVGTRKWSASAQHARNLSLPGGKVITLAASSNTTFATNGKPSNGTGNNGDAAFDAATGYLFVKASGAWAPSAALPVAGDVTGQTYASGVLTGYTKNGVAYAVSYVNGQLATVVGGGVTVTYNFTAGNFTGVTYS